MAPNKTTPIQIRMADEDLEQLDAVVQHLRVTRPEVAWSRSETIRELIQKAAKGLPAAKKPRAKS